MRKTNDHPPQASRTAQGNGTPRGKRTAPETRTRPPDGSGGTPKQRPPDATNSSRRAASDAPAGLDDAKHAAAQRAAHQAEVLRETLFPAMMADAIGYPNLFESTAYKTFLDGFIKDAGNPTDPVETMLLQQLAVAHFRIGQLHIGASHATGTESVKLYTAAASRLLGEFRRTALALRAYRGRVPEDKPEEKERLKILKMAK
jgi:hypothetical protein